MSANVPTREVDYGHIRTSSTQLLFALKAAHQQIEAAFAELDAECMQERADPSLFSAMRMRVGQALLVKRQIVGLVASHLILSAPPHEVCAVRELRSKDICYSQLASEIIRTWTPGAIKQDWGGYCAASRDLRARISSLIAAEKELYYRLLLK
jgi:hypothetical protein